VEPVTYDSVMVDLETTGLDPSHSAIIQIAAVRFDLETKQIDTSEMFDRCLASELPTRYWDVSTRQWWAQQKAETFENILIRAEDPKLVIDDFTLWLQRTPCRKPLQFWSKPISFDWPFLQSYWRQFGHIPPLHYRHAKDLNTYIYARGHTIDEFWKSIPSSGDKHNALNDVIYQIAGAFKA